MVLTPNDLFSWNNKHSKYTIILSRLYTLVIDSLFIFQLRTSTYSVHAGILKLWRGRLPCPLVVFSFHYGSRLPSSFVLSQLTLPVPTMRIRSPLPQDGPPIHRVRTHSLSRVQDKKAFIAFSWPAKDLSSLLVTKSGHWLLVTKSGHWLPASTQK
jgi:hypothetical protein